MPLTREEQLSLKLKRRQRVFHAVGQFLGALSAIVLVVLVGWTIIRQMDVRRKDREYRAQEMAYFGGPEGGATKSVSNQDTLPKRPRSPLRDEEPPMDFSRSMGGGTPSIAESDRQQASSDQSRGSVIQNLEDKRALIEDVVREYFAAGSTTEVLPLIRDARRVRPMVERYYAVNGFQKREWKGLGWTYPIDEPGHRFAYVQALFETGPPVNAVVEETDMGFFLDWESTVHYSDLGWKVFQDTRPSAPAAFRVLASKAQGKEGDPRAGGARAKLQLTHPTEGGAVIAEFDPADPKFQPLVDQLNLCQWKDVPVILRLCYPGPTADPDKVEIAGVEGKGWLILGSNRG